MHSVFKIWIRSGADGATWLLVCLALSTMFISVHGGDDDGKKDKVNGDEGGKEREEVQERDEEGGKEDTVDGDDGDDEKEDAVKGNKGGEEGGKEGEEGGKKGEEGGEWKGSCDPPKETELQPKQCCNITLFPQSFVLMHVICMISFENARKDPVCADQCVFMIAGLLNNNFHMEEDSVRSLFRPDKTIGNNRILDSVNRCLEVNEPAVEHSNSECKSGAAQFVKCLMREVFLLCPPTLAVESKECKDLNMKIYNCPDIEVNI